MNELKSLIYKEKIDSYMEAHREEFLAQLVELCRIDSVKAEPAMGAPFGAGVAECLAAALKLAEGFGFEVKNYDGYAGSADYCGALPAQLDILAHLDVVPAGSGWMVTEPFAPLIKDGCIYGRGTSDDKGPALAALYAMRAVKELGIPLRKNVRLILGTDEECGSSDIEYYYALEKEAPMTFSPDAEFPVVNIEKGRLHGRIFKKLESAPNTAVSISAQAGMKVNVVPAQAQASAGGISRDAISRAAQAAAIKTGVRFAFENNADKINIFAEGRGAHASTPEDGCNALTGLLELLAALPDGPWQVNAARDLLTLFPHGDVNGKTLGINLKDDISGELTLALSILKMDFDSISAEFDIRIPVCGDNTDLPALLRKEAAKYGFSLDVLSFTRAHHVPGDSDFVRTLLAAYETVTGKKGECIAMGGGTYVHDLESGVAFGAVMPGTDTRMHGPDEFAVINELTSAAKIYALAIAELCG